MQQTLVGFREYLDTELEAEGKQREVLREETKLAIESTFNEAKSDTDFAISSLGGWNHTHTHTQKHKAHTQH